MVAGDLLENLLQIDACSTLKVLLIGFQDLVPCQVLEKNKYVSLTDIICKIESGSNGAAFHHFALFAAKLSFLYPLIIDKSLGIKVLIYLMKPNINRKAMQTLLIPSIEEFIENNEDCNDLMAELDYSIEQKSELILKLIKNYSDYSDNELEELYKIAVNSPYTEVLIYLLELKQDYNKCFIAFLQCNNLEVKRKVFDWLGVCFGKLNGADLEDLKSEVVESLNFLVDIDSDKTAKIVRD